VNVIYYVLHKRICVARAERDCGVYSVDHNLLSGASQYHSKNFKIDKCTNRWHWYHW